MDHHNVAEAEQYGTHCLILDAAEKRFQQYGYGKTTMAEIALVHGLSRR